MRHLASKRYAKALLQLGIERNSISLFQSQLQQLAQVYETSEPFRQIIANPSIQIEERRKVMRAIAAKAGWDSIILNFGLILIDKDRIRYVDGIASEFQNLVDEHEGKVRADVVSARPLDSAQEEAIRKTIAELTKKDVIISTKVDPDLLGGVVTRVGDRLFDGSVRTQLNRIRETILQEV